MAIKKKDMHLKNTLTAICSLVTIMAFSQVPKKVVVEHFTNSRCSVCASRNPGFFTNYNSSNAGDMIHLAVHPSRPYSSCVFNQHNMAENDARTNYYGIFGSTPRLVINGEVISASSSYNSASLFTSYKSQTTPISLSLTQQYVGVDSIKVRVSVLVEATHSLAVQNLYVVLAEDTIFYNAPNGEDEHYDVFRNSLFGATGTAINLPSSVGDSLVFESTVAIDADWNEERMFALAILQDESTKEVTQSESLSAIGNNTISGVPLISTAGSFQVFPNPVNNLLNISLQKNETGEVKIVSITGKVVYTHIIERTVIVSTQNFENGVYFVSVTTSVGTHTKRIIKLN
ncbi:MAG: hypothetical protein ACI85Q_000875 [Salibacteraceae bacterium]